MPASFLRIRFTAFIILAAIFTTSASTPFITFERCQPGNENHLSDPQRNEVEAWERRACDAENAVYAQFESKLSMFHQAAQELWTFTNSGDWDGYRAKWLSILPMMRELRDTVEKNRQAHDLLSLINLYSVDLKLFFQDKGLGVASNLDEAAARIDATLGGEHAGAAAFAGITLATQSAERGVWFVRGLAQAAKEKVRQAKKSEDIAKRARWRDHVTGGSMAGYKEGFSTRFGLFRAVVEWTVLATLFAVLVAFRTRRPKMIVKMPIITLVVSTPLWVLHIFFPFVPGWLQFIVAVVAGMWLWGRSERWPAPWSWVFNTTPVAIPLTTHGSARWGTTHEMVTAGHLVAPGKPAGFALARAAAPRNLDPRFRYVGHVITVAPTGAGKGIGQVIPNLLEYPGSALVLDVKGENAAITAHARRALGHQVYVVDPFGVTQGATHAINLLDRIDPASPECVSESAILADALVIMEARASDGVHFDESAKTLLQGLMLHVAQLPQSTQRHLGELRRLLTADEETFFNVLAEMSLDPAAAYGLPARAAHTLLGMGDRERGSVLSTARRHTAFLDDPRLAAALTHSDFDMANIKRELMTVYLVMPANKIGTHARFIRAFIGSVVAAITSSTQPPPYRVAFFLDEFAQLGYMKQIEDAVSLLRSYGLSFWVFIQDLSQLKAVYPRWQTFLANSAKVFFGVDDHDTAKYVSDTLGKGTIEYETENMGRNRGMNLGGSNVGWNQGSSTGTSQQLTGRELLTPDEVMRLGSERSLVLVKGEYPYLLTRLNYLSDPEYVGLAAANPYHASAA